MRIHEATQNPFEEFEKANDTIIQEQNIEKPKISTAKLVACKGCNSEIPAKKGKDKCSTCEPSWDI